MKLRSMSDCSKAILEQSSFSHSAPWDTCLTVGEEQPLENNKNGFNKKFIKLSQKNILNCQRKKVKW